MRLEGEEQSENVEDRRRGGAGRAAGGIGLLGILLVLGVSLLTGKDPTQLLQLMQQTGVGMEQSAPEPGGPTTATLIPRCKKSAAV